MKISVVVPVYKAELYIANCIESILSQSYSDFELLLIDDGSPDGSGMICDEYSKRYDCIRVFHTANQGVSAARRLGVEKACCSEYIVFVDSDDTLPKDALSTLYTASDNGRYNLVIGGLDKSCVPDTEISPIVHRHLCIEGHFVICSPCAKLIRRDLLLGEALQIPRDIYFAEDALMHVSMAFANNLPVKLVSSSVYKITINQQSASRTFVMTQKYASRFYDNLLSLIPVDVRQNYKDSLIKLRLTQLAMINDAWDVLSFTSYKKQLQADINELNYPLGFLKWGYVKVRSHLVFQLWSFLLKVRTKVLLEFNKRIKLVDGGECDDCSVLRIPHYND